MRSVCFAQMVICSEFLLAIIWDELGVGRIKWRSEVEKASMRRDELLNDGR